MSMASGQGVLAGGYKAPPPTRHVPPALVPEALLDPEYEKVGPACPVARRNLLVKRLTDCNECMFCATSFHFTNSGDVYVNNGSLNIQFCTDCGQGLTDKTLVGKSRMHRNWKFIFQYPTAAMTTFASEATGLGYTSEGEDA